MVSSERKWKELYEAITDRMERNIYKNDIDWFKGQFKIDGGKDFCGMKNRYKQRDRIEGEGFKKKGNMKIGPEF